MKDDKIKVQLVGKERHFTRCYHDFLDSGLLTGEEKIVFLLLKRFMDVRTDQGEVFPSIKTIQSLTRWGDKKVLRVIRSLQKKGIVSIQRRGLTKSNLYIIKDRADMWKSETIEELQAAAEETKEEQAIRYLRSIGYTEFIKENAPKPNARPTTAADGLGANQNNLVINSTSNHSKSQDRKNKFHNFDQRDYDYDEIEKRLTNRGV